RSTTSARCMAHLAPQICDGAIAAREVRRPNETTLRRASQMSATRCADEQPCACILRGMSQPERYQKFLALHEREHGFVMPNAWDGASAVLLADAGFEALGTSSAALASSLGRLDGRHAVSRDEHLAHARLLGAISGLPINGDFEDGY